MKSPQEELREDAEKHWEYTKNVIMRARGMDEHDTDIIELCHYLYVEAFTHGAKHANDYG